MRQFLRDRIRLEPALARTAVRVHEWTTFVLSDDWETRLNGTRKETGSALDLIESIAETLVSEETRPTHELLSKSLQEVLLYCTGADPDLSYPQLKTRLMRFLERRGGAAIVRRFVALSLFNVIWFRTGDSFRAIAPTPETFEEDMRAVERLCRRIAASAWFSLNRSSIDAAAIDEVISNIEKRLCNGVLR
jgi:hypothetical protein